MKITGLKNRLRFTSGKSTSPTFTVNIYISDEEKENLSNSEDFKLGVECDSPNIEVQYVNSQEVLYDGTRTQCMVWRGPITHNRLHLSFEVHRTAVGRNAEIQEYTITLFAENMDGERLAEETIELDG